MNNYVGVLTEKEARDYARAETQFWFAKLPLFGLKTNPDSENTKWATEQYADSIYQSLSRKYQIIP